MGLDFSHCDVSWGYIGFGNFRNRLAREINFPEYESIRNTDDPAFEKIKEDGLLPLLAHSDCDGDLTPDECRTVAPRLREIVSKWADDDKDKSKAIELAEGMEYAASLNESLRFE